MTKLEETIKKIVTEIKEARYEINATPAEKRKEVVAKHKERLWEIYKWHVMELPFDDEWRTHLCDLVGICNAALNEAEEH